MRARNQEEIAPDEAKRTGHNPGYATLKEVYVFDYWCHLDTAEMKQTRGSETAEALTMLSSLVSMRWV